MSRDEGATPASVKRLAEYAYLNLDNSDLNKNFGNPLEIMDPENSQEPHLHFIRLLMDPENFWWTCAEILGVDLLPFQIVVLQELWTHKFPMFLMTRGGGKSWLLAVYSLLRALLIPETKIIVTGAGFRQSKIIFEYAVSIWENSKLLQDICTNGGKIAGQGPHRQPDMYYLTIGKSRIMACPVGDGQKIRGLRANTVIADEFAAMNEDIFERVLGGFGAVSQNPVKSVKDRAKEKVYSKHGIDTTRFKEQLGFGNQTIISGTAYYDFNHFAKYHRKWKAIIESGGNMAKLQSKIDADDIPSGFNYKDYCIIRVPVGLLPDGFMDEGNIARAKATIDSGTFATEYDCVFSKDSQGFYKRTLIESCVASDLKPIQLSSGPITFRASVRGNPNYKYVYGIDPAILNDNFSIVVLELHPDHRRIVYCWVSNRKMHRLRLANNLTQEQNFYDFCARKIRDLMKVFPPLLIGMDSQGGGAAVEEALQDDKHLEPGERKILPTIDVDKPKPTDDDAGDHILEMVQFAKSDWVRDANGGMRKDFEDKVLLFPHFDPAILEEAAFIDSEEEILYDSLEDVMQNLEELKDELATIVHTQTNNGTDRWDTPEVKLPGNKKGRLRKDRYSALLIANMVARTYLRQRPLFSYDLGLSQYKGDKALSEVVEIGPEWYMNALAGASSKIYGGR